MFFWKLHVFDKNIWIATRKICNIFLSPKSRKYVDSAFSDFFIPGAAEILVDNQSPEIKKYFVFLVVNMWLKAIRVGGVG
ncbi:hypothetical protein MHK_005733 [Candidatus Magnetomorum sp. HK-1]|nr:hypothetical protein MHK_005733 [Candidatus Magnetomorum sp. HK-1]